MTRSRSAGRLLVLWRGSVPRGCRACRHSSMMTARRSVSLSPRDVGIYSTRQATSQRRRDPSLLIRAHLVSTMLLWFAKTVNGPPMQRVQRSLSGDRHRVPAVPSGLVLAEPKLLVDRSN